MFKFAVIVVLVLQVSLSFSQNIKFEGIPDGSPLKRDTEYQMYWVGRLTSQIVSVQLRQHDIVMHEGPGFLKSGKYQVKLPGDLKLGGYTMVVLDPSSNTVLQSGQVEIKRRIPLIAHAAVVLLGYFTLLLVVPA